MSKPAHTGKAKKPDGDWHVSNTSLGMGDYYGTGIKAKVGKMREGHGQIQSTPKQLKKPPRSLA
jgi:hypothetical protein